MSEAHNHCINLQKTCLLYGLGLLTFLKLKMGHYPFHNRNYTTNPNCSRRHTTNAKPATLSITDTQGTEPISNTAPAFVITCAAMICKSATAAPETLLSVKE